jgi:hypothetical protein
MMVVQAVPSFHPSAEVFMKLRHLFALNIFFALFFGLSCPLLPRWVFSLYGVTADDAAVWTARLVGGSILGFATLMWFGLKASSAETRRAIAIALIVQDTIGCIASIHFQLTADVNIFGWLSLSLYGLLAVAYAYFVIARPESC